MAEQGNARYGPAPDIAVIADTAAGIARGEATVAAAGAQVAFVGGTVQGRARLADRIRVDAVLAMIDGTAGPATDELFSEIADAAEEGRARGVVSIPFGMLDAAHGRLAHRDIEILCDPSEPELVGALSLAMVRPTAALRDPAGKGRGNDLLRISEEVGRIARALAELSGGEAGLGGRSELGEAPFAYRAEPVASEALDADQVRRVIRLRRLRDRYFDPGLFADPAWDMLLDLMAARLERRDVAVSSLCIAAAVPPTTALRWIKTMTEAGLFERRADPRDGRRIFIILSDRAADAVERWFAAVQGESGDPAV